jgi:deoxycytidine triphosphate deaminase
MWLSAAEIARRVRDGQLGISPFEERMLKPASYVLRLGAQCLVWKTRPCPIILSEYKAQDADFDRVPTEEAVIHQGNTLLVSTLEKVSIGEDLVGILSNLSHLARFGLNVLNGSIIVSPGFGQQSPSQLTMEFVSNNPNPIQLKPGLPVCHLAFQTLLGAGTPNRKLSTSVYEAMPAPAPPMYWQEFADHLTEINHSSSGQKR